MIMANDRGAAITRSAMRGNEHCRINLESVARLCGDVGGGAQLRDLRGMIGLSRRAQQQAATFIWDGNARKSADFL